MSTLIYLYGHVPADAPEPGLRGVADAPVELRECGEAAAVVSRVPADDYAADAIEARLQDLDWVGEQGLAHERVVAWLTDRTTVVPARLFTLFSGEEALRADCRQRAGWVAAQLARLGGVREWDLKVAYQADRLSEHLGELSPEIAELDRAIEEAPAGRRYLLQRQRAERAKDVLRDAARAAAAEVLDELKALARDSRLVSPPRAAQGAPVVLSAALLLPREREEEAAARAAAAAGRLEPRGLAVSFTGPWAAYRFVESE